jgi:hypothetical protein
LFLVWFCSKTVILLTENCNVPLIYIDKYMDPHLRTPNPGFNSGFTPLLYNKCGG